MYRRFWGMAAVIFGGLILSLGIAVAGENKLLGANDVKSLIEGGTRAGYFSGGTYYITFLKDGNYCLRGNTKAGVCFEKGPWWIEKNSVCRKSESRGEYCWTISKTGENKYRSEIARVKDSSFNVGETGDFWME